MLNIKKWLAMLLTVSLLFNLTPLNVLAEEPAEDEIVVETPVEPKVSAEPTAESSPEVSPEPTPEVTPEPTPEVTPEPEVPEEPQTPETPTVDETPAEDEESLPAEGEEGEEESLAEVLEYTEYRDPFANQFATKLIRYGLATEESVRSIIIESLIGESDSSITLKVGTNARILVLLSNQIQTESAYYYNWTIDFDISGSLVLANEKQPVTVDVPDSTDTLTYKGLGDDSFPFAGTFTGNIGGFTSSYTIFKSVSTAVNIKLNGRETMPITWDGPQNMPILANSVVVPSAEEHTLNFPATSSSTFSPYIGELKGASGRVILSTLDYSNAKTSYTGDNPPPTTGNLGLICNTMGDYTNLQIANLLLPAQIDLRGTENVGGLVGQMNSGATLHISQDITLNAKLEGTNAGGLVGSMAENSKLIISQKLKLNLNVLLIGGNSAGGLVGKIDGGLIQFETDAGVDITAELKATNAGGIAGDVSTAAGPLVISDNAQTTILTVSPESPSDMLLPDTSSENETESTSDPTPTLDPVPTPESTSAAESTPAPTVAPTPTPTPAPADEETEELEAAMLLFSLDDETTEDGDAPEPIEASLPAPADTGLAAPESTELPEAFSEGEDESSPSLFSGLVSLFTSLFASDEPSPQPEPALENIRISSVKANGSSNAGVLYGKCTVSGAADPTKTFDPFYGVTFTDDAMKEVSGPGNCGGVFGTLTLNGGGKCRISGTDENNPLAISSTLTTATNNTQYGGIAGTLSGTERKHALVVQYCNITSTVNVGTDAKNYPKYIGGIVAVQGANTTVDAKYSTVTLSQPRTPTNTYGIGGLCTEVGDGALLIADTMKVVIDSFVTNQGSSGVAASTGKGTIVYLKNSLDLSECLLETCAYSGQIVGKQDSSLIYAPNVTISRLKTDKYDGMELDDIGNYGELYRIADFLTVDQENGYSVDFPHKISKKDGIDNEYELSSALDYACLALAWQSRGNFPTVNGIKSASDSWSTLKSSKITLGADINLTDCGVGGLTRDYDKDSTNDTFTGTFDGVGHTLTLDIGAENQDESAKVPKGDGRIYGHNATGLFAVLSSSATVNNLKLAGSIRLSNNNNKLGTITMHSGTLAAKMDGSPADGSTLSTVSTSVKYDVITNGGNTLYLGGLIGLISGGSARIDFDTGTNLASTITISHSGNGSTNHFGGAIGAIAGGASAEITCNGAIIGGSINSTPAKAINNFYAGGLVGTILPGSNKSRTISIANLIYSDFTLSGNASERMGGILGSIWADTDVTIDGLTVSNTSLISSNTANTVELGGLVYRASGKWTVSSVDLSGLTIEASKAKALGLMVCHGEPNSEPINGAKDVGGLYLEMAEHWDTGYIVSTEDNSVSITFGSGVFDEFVAYTAYRDASGSYNITHNGSGIISLKTNNDTVNMDTSGERNTYENRTRVGQNKQTNQYSRYYYNLDSIMGTFTARSAELAAAQAEAEAAALAAAEAEAAVAGVEDPDLLAAAQKAALAAQTAAEEAAALAASTTKIDEAGKLLIWSVCRYADSTLRKHFTIPGIDNLYAVTKIGGTSATSRANFDMKGLSYYPIDITNEDITNEDITNEDITKENITVQYADVTFYNNDIETKEAGNKLTREHTQHYTMHCALFNNFTAENITTSTDYTLTVNGVSFAGSVGVVNGGSGALLCGKVAGLYDGKNTAICKVLLASADNEDNAVTLSGLAVMPEGDYTPVLINTLEGYTTLEANYITTSDAQTSRAGSSLIGNVGGADANKVTVSFAGTIRLPETPNKVFTEATLLNSLRYVDGSATYTFTSGKDSGDTRNSTHGYELSESVEYAEKCGFYDDDTDGTKKVLFPDGESDFKSYLPYVALSPAKDQKNYPLSGKWHELAVNIHSEPLTNGCGTYGHPYVVTEKEFREAASFLNTGVAATGWQVRVPNPDHDAYHNSDGEYDILLTYQNGGWKKEDSSTYTGDVRAHLQSAYYRLAYPKDENGIEKTEFTLSNFQGIGTNPDWAFKGVITGKIDDSHNVTVTLTGGSSAFIKYSYGCVVRDVNFTLQQTPTLTREDPVRGTTTISSTTYSLTPEQQAPKTFFGGVIGCVLGGDNIIDGVTVSAENASIVTMLLGSESFKLTLAGTNPHLIPVGGYVGVIAGGGVIFRGTVTDNTGIMGTDAQLYRNPIIGRVLGGYAFYESKEEIATAPNNSDKNYTISKITPAQDANKDLSWDGSTLTVNTAQGLFLLSAIVSSGAGSAASNAYKNGVARNAAYDHIGETTKPGDYEIAKSEGKISYLSNYVSGIGSIGNICTSGTNGITIKFAEKMESETEEQYKARFNMADYGNGYRGLSARYVSNAAFKTDDNGNPVVDASTVVLRVKTFDGQNATVQNINMNVKEYANDDFHMASMGGIFNIVWTQKQSGGGGAGSNFAQNLTLQDCNVSLKYVNSSGAEVDLADGDTLSDADGRFSISVGGFIGMANDVEASQGSINHNYLFTNIHIEGTDSEKCKIYGPNGVGGLIGTTAMASTSVKGYPGKLLANSNWALFGPSFLNCSYSNVEVTAGMAAGGLIGDAYASGSSTVPGFSGLGISYNSDIKFLCYASCTVTDKNLTVGNNSTITARAKQSIAAGIFGAAGMRVGVNESEASRAEKTGLTISETASTLRLSNVKVQVSNEEHNAGSYPDSGANNAYAGGIIARIGSVNPGCFYDINISGGSVKSTYASASRVGGIVGSGYTNSTITMQRCNISIPTISGANVGGFLGYGLNETFKLYLLDSIIKNSNVTGSSYTGGIVGYAQGNYYFNNILIKNTAITGGTKSRLIGAANFKDPTAKTGFSIYAAGISVYVDPARTDIQLPSQDLNQTDYVGYIAYADYAGTDTAPNPAVPGQQVLSPYVTVNPYYALNGTKSMTGDAVKINRTDKDNVIPVASRILEDQKSEVTDENKLNRVPYQNISSDIKAKGLPEISTFKAVQGCGPNDLPVLTIKGGDAGVIEDYLNVITNGGYAKAKTITKNATTVADKVLELNVSVYAFENGSFVPKDKEALTAPASVYVDNGELKVLGSSYDNTRNRFSLVEATFKVTVDGTPRTYTVSIPVVVIRELQYDFMATFAYGAEFHASVFDERTTHVLESTGNPFTGYLSYVYNREKGEYAPYDWQSYMDAGGSMLAVDKTLTFSNGLPADTQMILIDCQDGNRAYQYQVGEAGISKVNLSEFTSVCDPNGTVKFCSSMADVLGVTVEEAANGKFVQLENATDATVRLRGKYYRLYTDGDGSNVKRYKLTVPDLSKEENKPVENYYLVITVPDQLDENGEKKTDYSLNGILTTELNWTTMPNNGTKVHRKPNKEGKLDLDNGNSTESTYLISTGYTQDLTSTAKIGEAINLMDANKKMQVALKDTISFFREQAYDKNDPLFVKFNVSLQEHKQDEAGSKELRFPVGTTGTVQFYVQDKAGTYYYPDGDAWKTTKTKSDAGIGYDWSSQGGNMALLLSASADGREALNLAPVRQAIKNNTALESKIIITAEMEVNFAGQEVLDAAVPASDQLGVDIWAQLHYVALLSTQAGSLDYTANRTAVDDNAKYYRAVQYQAVLSMDATVIDQLGVNPLQLVQDYQETVNGKNASQIELIAALNLANLPDYESTLRDTKEIQFSLSLERRGEPDYTTVANAGDYVSFTWVPNNPEGREGYEASGWSYSITGEDGAFSANNKALTNDLFDGAQFTIPLTAYVFTDQTDFANYKIKLSVSLLGADDNQITVALDDKDAYVVYTYACIKPTFYVPTSTAGN